MRLHAATFLTREGEPITGRAPPVLRMEGELSAAQESELAQIYRAFCDRKMLSLVQQHAVEQTMTDGSRVRMLSISDRDEVFVWPVVPGRDLPTWFIAYPVFAGIDFMPVYDREVIDQSVTDRPPYPKEPKWTEPRPVQQYAQRAIVRVRGRPNANPWTQFLYTVSLVLGGSESEVASGRYYFDDEKGFHHYEHVPLIMMNLRSQDGLVMDFQSLSTEVPRAANGTPISELSKGVLVTGVKGAFQTSDFVVGPDVMGPREEVLKPGADIDYSVMDQVAQINISANAQDAAYEAQYQQALTAYEQAYQTWLRTVYQKWLDDCKAIDDGYPPLGDYPMDGMRRAGRASQVQAINDLLEQGLAQPHLAARWLTLPFNVGFEPVGGALPSQGTVTADGPKDVAGRTDRSIVFTASGADRACTVPDPVGSDPIDIAQFGHDPAHPLGRDLANPRALFGFVANGAYQRYAAYRTYHNNELPEVRGVEDVAFSLRPGYGEFLTRGVQRTASKTAVINSDGFVPPGTKLTVVLFEWECWDPFVGEWAWLPHPDLVKVDAVWVDRLGMFSMPPRKPLPDGAVSPRAVRVRRMTEQRRLDGMDWSKPEVATLENPWSSVIETGLGLVPTGVAIVEGLAPTAAPIRGGESPWPHGESFLWSGDPEGLAAGMAAPWDNLGTYVPLIAAALRCARKA